VLIRRHEQEERAQEREQVHQTRLERVQEVRDQMRELGRTPLPKDDVGKVARVAQSTFLLGEEQLNLKKYDQALYYFKIVRDIDPAYPKLDERIAEAERGLRQAS
ncbi:MAG TPA: hypothetical protein VJ885_18745, partial [Thermoanaerobaculia bacterium]|nr:hypothetical protein [Thermoanaerobaculia bacterium]